MDGDGNDGVSAPAGPGPAESSEVGDASYGLGTFNAPDNTGSFGGLSSIFNAAMDSQDASTALGFDPSTMGVMTNPATEADQSFFDSTIGKSLMSLLALTHPAFAMGKFAMDAAKDPGKAFGGKGFGMLGQAVAGPLGGMMGSALGSSLGAGAFNGTTGTAADASASPNSPGDWGSLLAGLYTGYKGLQSNGQMLGGLQDLYSQNSPYAQTMRQQLERRDAAAGRRSQYGPREVELQAKLAQLASQQIPAMSQMANNQTLMRAAMLRNALGFGDKLGLFKGLNSLFQNGDNNWAQSWMPTPSHDFGDISWGL